MNKPILLLSSSNLSYDLNNLYYLKNYASILNLEDEVKDEDAKAYQSKNIIICNMKDEKQVVKLRFIPQEAVYRVAVLRKWESASEDWVVKAHCDFVIKETGFFRECSSVAEVFNFIRHLNNFKKPDGNFMFYLKKFKSFLSCLGSSSS